METIIGLDGIVKKAAKVSRPKKDDPIEPPKLEVHIQPDMLVLCDAFRINDCTKAALTDYDACTLEDFAFMTREDFEGMLVTSTRMRRPLCPLQQRKVAVMWWWVQQLVKDSPPFKEEKQGEEKQDHEGEKKVEEPWMKSKVIPPNWENQLQADLPMLKKKLREVGATTSWSIWSDGLADMRWLCCGYN